MDDDEAVGGEPRHEVPEPGEGAILRVGIDAGGQRGESETLATGQRRERGHDAATIVARGAAPRPLLRARPVGSPRLTCQATGAEGDATKALQRADQAGRRGVGAQRGAEVHQGLVPGPGASAQQHPAPLTELAEHRPGGSAAPGRPDPVSRSRPSGCTWSGSAPIASPSSTSEASTCSPVPTASAASRVQPPANTA